MNGLALRRKRRALVKGSTREQMSSREKKKNDIKWNWKMLKRVTILSFRLRRKRFKMRTTVCWKSQETSIIS